MSEYSNIMSKIEEVVDLCFGEKVLIRPQTRSDYLVGTADTKNEPYELIGIVDIDEALLDLGSRATKDQVGAHILAANGQVSFDLNSFSVYKPIPKNNWLLTLLDRIGKPVLRIISSRQDGAGRLHIAVEVSTR